MRVQTPILAFTVLLLAACGEDQTAQAPSDARSPASTETGPTPPPAPPNPPSTTGNVGVSPPAASSQTAAAPSAASLQSFQGRPYAAGPLSLQLNADNTFVMNEVEGNRKVEGRYAFQGGTVTFSDPKGDVGPAKFPMRCRFEPAGNEFRLVDEGGSCDRFKELTFKPAAG